MSLKWLLEGFLSWAAGPFNFIVYCSSAISALIALSDIVFRLLGTTLTQLLADHFGVVIGDAVGLPAEITLAALLFVIALLRLFSIREANRREGIAQLADACCIHTLRLVALVQELRKGPQRASNALDSDGLYGIPLESARFRFRIANVRLCKGSKVWSSLEKGDERPGGCDCEPSEELIASDVEYDFKFKLAWHTKFRNRLPLVSWIFGDNGKRPEQFRYYYSHRSATNDIIASPQPYKKSSFSYSPNEGLYVVSHDVRPTSVGPDRIFGMHYFKRGCLGWDFDDDFTIYPTAIAGDVRKATFRVELQKDICDVLDSNGGARLELHEVICSGRSPKSGHRPAHFVRTGTIATGVLGVGEGCGSEVSSASLFENGREYVVFETSEIDINPNNVYIVLVRAEPGALNEMRQVFEPGNMDGVEGPSTCKQRISSCLYKSFKKIFR